MAPPPGRCSTWGRATATTWPGWPADFPDKQYLGIDVEADHIDVARRTVAQPSLRFERGDLYTATGRYDALLARLLFQHLTRVPEALDAVAILLRPGGVAVIVDAHDAARHFDPAPPEYLRFFRAYTANQATHGMSREAALRVPELVKVHPRLECARVTDVVIPSTIGENLELFKKTYYLVILMVEHTGRLRHDFGRVKAEWRRWCAADRVYMQVGIRIIQLARRDAATRCEPRPSPRAGAMIWACARTSRHDGRAARRTPADTGGAWSATSPREASSRGSAPGSGRRGAQGLIHARGHPYWDLAPARAFRPRASSPWPS